MSTKEYDQGTNSGTSEGGDWSTAGRTDSTPVGREGRGDGRTESSSV